MTSELTGDTDPAREPDCQGGGSQLPWRWQFIVATLLLVAFAVLTVFMLSWANAKPPVWQNRIYVFSSVEAIVFTAVGWIFGREVHRAEAESAQQQAGEAKVDAKENLELARQKADEAAGERAKGMSLAAAVATLPAGPAGRRGQARDAGAAAEDSGSSAQLASVKDLARRLYGDLHEDG